MGLKMEAIMAKAGSKFVLALGEAIPVDGRLIQLVQKLGNVALDAWKDMDAFQELEQELLYILSMCDQVGQRLDRLDPSMREQLRTRMARHVEKLSGPEAQARMNVFPQEALKEIREVISDLHMASLFAMTCVQFDMQSGANPQAGAAITEPVTVFNIDDGHVVMRNPRWRREWDSDSSRRAFKDFTSGVVVGWIDASGQGHGMIEHMFFRDKCAL